VTLGNDAFDPHPRMLDERQKFLAVARGLRESREKIHAAA
jgi:hypothetical protein